VSDVDLTEQLKAALEANERLAQRVAELEAENERLREKLGENSSNSGKPPSSDTPSQREKNRQKRKRRQDKKRRGGQPGHKGSHRELLPPEAVDHIEDHYPQQCESCWEHLAPQSYGMSWRLQVTELSTKGGVIVTEHRCHSVRCHCGYVTKASRDTMPRSAFGPRLSAIVGLLTGVFHLSRRQAKQLLFDLFGISISLGTISNIEARMSKRLAPGYQQAKAAADDAKVKHTDGTGWARAGKALSLWVVATTTVTVFSMVKNGRAKTLRTLFGRIKGILISDRAKAINFWKMKRRQVCWAHLHRKFISFSERAGPAGAIGKELSELCDVLFETYRAFVTGVISRRVFRQRMAPVREQVEALLQKAVRAKIKRLSGSCEDILAHKEALWTFVRRLDVEPTNNHAERELRSFVLWRKKSFGTQSEHGDRFAERIMTTVHSLRKQQRPVLQHLHALLTTQADSELPALVAG
jgi:transposase